MVTVVVKKKLFFLVILGLVGFALLSIGLRGGLLYKDAGQGVEVNTDTGSISIEGDGKKSVNDLMNNIVLDKKANTGQDFFIDYRMEREQTRGQQVEWLREVINNSSTADETRQKAQEHLMAISRSMEKESELENLIRAKGFADAAVMLDDNAVTAIVAADRLSSEEVSVINGLISKRTGIDPQKVTIINKNK